MIDVESLSVRIGRTTIVEGVSFRAGAGAITAIVGPNGSGKTTLLKALSGELAFGGTTRMNGLRLETLKPWQAASMRAVLPQATALSFPFTVREVVALGLVRGDAGLEQYEVASLPNRALARVDLQDFGHRHYQELSGGEQQRVQLARVLCQVWQPVQDGHPRWLLLDEPVSSLDIRHQLAIMEIAQAYARAGGGVIAVMHDLNLTAMFAGKIVVMRRGRIVAVGPPHDVMTDDILSAAYDCRLRVSVTPQTAVPFVLPQSASEEVL